MRREIKPSLQANISQKYSRQKLLKLVNILTKLQLIIDGVFFLTHGVHSLDSLYKETAAIHVGYQNVIPGNIFKRCNTVDNLEDTRMVVGNRAMWRLSSSNAPP